jgi:hypothetical protein
MRPVYRRARWRKCSAVAETPDPAIQSKVIWRPLTAVKIRPEFLLLAGLPVSFWSGYGHDPQHTALSPVGSQPLNQIRWSTPVDLNPQSTAGDLYIHYGSPAITAAHTVLLPVKTGAAGGFEVQAHNGATGSFLYTLPSDYSLPPHVWVPPYGIVLSERTATSTPGRSGRAIARRPVPESTERLYYAGAGGTVYYRDQVDSPTGPNGAAGATGQIAFYGNAVYAASSASFNSSVEISTPLTADSAGNVYFGFIASGSNPANLTSGIARISSDGTGTWMSAQALSGGDTSITQGALNCAPALSPDQTIVHFAVSNGVEFGAGYLAAADSITLAPLAHVTLMDPRGGLATVSADSSASPMVGSDGDVYYGVLEGNCCSSHNDRGWMLHFNSTLTQSKIPGSFGWDDTASVVPSNLVPSYSGASSYLILVKYNDYAGVGTGTGVNKLAVLDPNAIQQDEYSATPVQVMPVQVMKEVLTITGVTPDPAGGPNAVREWCINTAAIDPSTKSALVNSEDGVVYRWDFTTNTFTQSMRLTSGRGEAYTPTVIGTDGTVYAINDAILFALGN